MNKKTMTSTALLSAIRSIIAEARTRVYATINASVVFAYWEIGCKIVEDEQRGHRRAAYGKAVLKEIAEKLTDEFGNGFEERELRRMRQLYLTFPIRDALRPELSWTHYRILLRVEKAEARAYYMEEAISQQWSSRILERQINSFYFERLVSSKKKGPVKAEAKAIALGQMQKPTDYIRDPVVLEFLGVPVGSSIKEKDLETALITHIQTFLLELGKGFAFVARQQRIRTENTDFYVDLVFYHFQLRCFVLVDLKTGALTHQDVGQMDMYVRMYDDLKRQNGDNPTIGIILCSDKDSTIVKYSVLSEGRNIFASRYRLYLPTEDELRNLVENDRQIFETRGFKSDRES